MLYFSTNWRAVAALQSSVYWHHFFTSMSSLCVCHILVIPEIFQTFSSLYIIILCIILHIILYYGDLSSVWFFEVTIVIVSGYHELHRYNTAHLIQVVCVLTAPPTSCSLSPSPQASTFPEIILELGQLTTLQWPLCIK